MSGHVYVVEIRPGVVKIGWSEALANRMKSHRATYRGCRLLASYVARDRREEKRVHEIYRDLLVLGEREIFRFDPSMLRLHQTVESGDEPPKEPSRNVSVRISKEMGDALRVEQARLQSMTPGARISLSDVARMLVASQLMVSST